MAAHFQGVQGHPAAQAWLRLGPQRAEVCSIELLKGRPADSAPMKRMVCRLSLSCGHSVVAKLCKQEKALVEQTIYRDVLPSLQQAGIHGLRYYGMTEEIAGELAWIFIESVDGAPYSSVYSSHRTWAAVWLATLHTRTTALAASSLQLPDAGPKRYLNRLHRIRSQLAALRDMHYLDPQLHGILNEVDSVCSRVAASWSQLEAYCTGLPAAVVHGDFVPKNILVGDTSAGNPVLVYDWSTAGWGTPAVDLAGVDIAAYHSALLEAGKSPEPTALTGLVSVGRMFRYIAAIDWELPKLRFPWVDKPVANLKIYLAAIRQTQTEMRLGF